MNDFRLLYQFSLQKSYPFLNMPHFFKVIIEHDSQCGT